MADPVDPDGVESAQPLLHTDTPLATPAIARGAKSRHPGPKRHIAA